MVADQTQYTTNSKKKDKHELTFAIVAIVSLVQALNNLQKKKKNTTYSHTHTHVQSVEAHLLECDC